MRRVLETWGTCCHSNSIGQPSANTGVKNSQRSEIIIIEDYIEKSKVRLITATRNNINDTTINRIIITRKQNWEGKQLYGHFKQLTSDISHEKTWTWLKKGNLKRETESLLIAAQTNAIRTNHIKARIDKTQQNSRCQLSGDRYERSIVVLYTTRIQIYMGTESTDNDNFNKRTNILLYKNINLSHFIFEKVMFVACEKWMETRMDCYIDPSSSLDHSSTSFASWLKLLNRGSLGAQGPLSTAGSHFGILSPTDSNALDTWLYYFLTSTCFHCSFTYLQRCISWVTARLRVNI